MGWAPGAIPLRLLDLAFIPAPRIPPSGPGMPVSLWVSVLLPLLSRNSVARVVGFCFPFLKFYQVVHPCLRQRPSVSALSHPGSIRGSCSTEEFLDPGSEGSLL